MPLLQARKQLIDFRQRLVLVAQPAAKAVKAAQHQVVFHRHFGEQFALFGHQVHAGGHHFLDLGMFLRLAAEDDAAGGRQHAHDGGQQGGLARAIGADHGHDLAFAHRQADARYGFHLVVGHAQVAHFQQIRAHHSTPPR
ncbi:hypothetical protein D3C72_1824540 [compost metagenome]